MWKLIPYLIQSKKLDSIYLTNKNKNYIPQWTTANGPTTDLRADKNSTVRWLKTETSEKQKKSSINI